MTTATTTAGQPAAATRRPVPWTSIGWVTLRQRRGAMIGVSVLLGLIAVYLVIMAIIQNNAYAAVTACHPAAAVKCQQLAQNFSSTYWGGHDSALQSGGAQTVSSLMFVVPVLLGAFVGAPLISRELDTGTFRFAWTQGAGRTRWAVSTLVLPALLLTAVTGAFTALFWWCFRPFLADGLGSGNYRVNVILGAGQASHSELIELESGKTIVKDIRVQHPNPARRPGVR